MTTFSFINPFTAKKLRTVFCAVLFLGIFSCHNNGNAPDVSGISVKLDSRRLDLDLAALDTNHIGTALNSLHTRYSDFLDFYLDSLLGYNIRFRYTDTAAGIRIAMKPFLTHKDCRGLLDTVKAHYPDTKTIEADLKKGLQYLKYYDSSYRFDNVVYFTSCLNNWGVITYSQRTIGIGLDMFLGPKYPFYAAVDVPEYAAKNMEAKNIVPNVFKAIYEDRHPFIVNDRDLLSLMIEKGKEQYFLARMLPFVPQEILLGYTPAQLEWCRRNEELVFNFFVQQKMIYDKNQQKVVRYIMEGPEAAGMPAGSPGSVGIYIGLRIISAYMEHHPDTGLNELLNNNDDQAILQEAHYNPR